MKRHFIWHHLSNAGKISTVVLRMEMGLIINIQDELFFCHFSEYLSSKLTQNQIKLLLFLNYMSRNWDGMTF